MDSSRPQRVTLTGDVSGAYVVVERRPDGSLVVAPDSSKRSGAAPPKASSGLARLLAGLVAPPEKAMSGEEVLEGWGVELDAEESIEEFLVADVDDTAGFLAITSQRFIFVAHGTVRHEYLLSAARDVELVRRGLSHKVRVVWHGAESLVGGLDRKTAERLRDRLQRLNPR